MTVTTKLRRARRSARWGSHGPLRRLYSHRLSRAIALPAVRWMAFTEAPRSAPFSPGDQSYRVLAALELDRFSFGDVLGCAIGMNGGGKLIRGIGAYPHRLHDLCGLVDGLRHDLADLRRETPNAGVGASFDHRLFDVDWLVSPRVHFELVGVVDRLDFRSLVPPGCGQTRLVYRLAFRPPHRPVTRLPLTVNVIYENRDESCDGLARRWLAVEDRGDVLSRLQAGPLARLDPTRFDRIEVDLQSLRENSKSEGWTIMPNIFCVSGPYKTNT